MPVSNSNSTYFYTSSGKASPGAVSSYLSTGAAQPQGAQQSQRQQQNPGRLASTTSTYVMQPSGTSTGAASSYLIAGKAQPQGAQQSQRQQQNPGRLASTTSTYVMQPSGTSTGAASSYLIAGKAQPQGAQQSQLQQQNSGRITTTNSTYFMPPGARASGNASAYQMGQQTANNTSASAAQDPTRTAIHAPTSTRTAIASLPRNPMVTAMLPPMQEETRTAVYPLSQDSQTAVVMDQTYYDAPTEVEMPTSTRTQVTQFQTTMYADAADKTSASGAPNASGPASTTFNAPTGASNASVYYGAQVKGASNPSVYMGAGGAPNASGPASTTFNVQAGLSNTSTYVETGAHGIGTDIQSVYVMAK